MSLEISQSFSEKFVLTQRKKGLGINPNCSYNVLQEESKILIPSKKIVKTRMQNKTQRLKPCRVHKPLANITNKMPFIIIKESFKSRRSTATTISTNSKTSASLSASEQQDQESQNEVPFEDLLPVVKQSYTQNYVTILERGKKYLCLIRRYCNTQRVTSQRR